MIEEGAYPGCLLVRGLEERRERLGLHFSHRQDAQAVTVEELEARIAITDLFPEPPDAEALLPHVGVVQQEDASRADLGEPLFEVVLHGLVGVEAVNMEEIDRAV